MHKITRAFIILINLHLLIRLVFLFKKTLSSNKMFNGKYILNVTLYANCFFSCSEVSLKTHYTALDFGSCFTPKQNIAVDQLLTESHTFQWLYKNNKFDPISYLKSHIVHHHEHWNIPTLSTHTVRS